MSDAEVELVMHTLVESVQTYDQVVEVRVSHPLETSELMFLFL